MDAKTKKQISLGVVLSYISIAVKLASGLIYAPIMLHSLGQSQYGVYSLCTSFIGYLTILNAGVNAAYIRFYVQEKTLHVENVDKLNGLFCKVFIILSVVALIGGLFIAQFSPMIFGSKITADEYELVRSCFILLSFATAIEIFTCVFKSFITANEEFIFAKSIDILSSVIYPIIAIPLLLNGADCTDIIIVHLGVSVLIMLLDVLFCRKKIRIKFAFAKTEEGLMRNIVQFIGFIFLQSILDQLNWEIDKFILARTQGTTEISIYTVGGTFNSYFFTIGAAVSGVFIAEINRIVARNDDERINSLFRITCKLFTYLIGFIIIAFLSFGDLFIRRWAGAEYRKSFTVGWLLMVPVTWVLITGIAQDIVRAKNKHQTLILINFGVCVVNTIISVPLATRWGAVGSALGTFLAEIVICLIVNPIYYKKCINLYMGVVFRDFLRYLPGIVIPALYAIVINVFGIVKASYLSIVVYGIVFTVIYAVSVWFISMNKNDRITLLSYIGIRR